MVDCDLEDDLIKSILHEYRCSNADLIFRCNATVDDLIDVIEGNRKYIPCLYALNKIDDITIEELDILSNIPHYVPVSAHLEWNLDEMVEKCWEYLDLIRVYTKPKGLFPDYEEPVVLPKKNSDMKGFCMRIHRNLLKEFKYGLVWGMSVKHNPQKCGKEH